jgi:hypothetical protein
MRNYLLSYLNPATGVVNATKMVETVVKATAASGVLGFFLVSAWIAIIGLNYCVGKPGYVRSGDLYFTDRGCERKIDIVVSSHDPLKELEKAGQKTGGDDNDKNKRRRTKEKAPRPSWHDLRGKQRKPVRPR